MLPVKDLLHFGHGDPDDISPQRRSYLTKFQTLYKFREAMKRQEDMYWLPRFGIYDRVAARFRCTGSGDMAEQFESLMCDMEEKLAASQEADVVFSTVHQAKGLGFENVVTLEDFLDDRTEEEYNIFYVACSRVSTGVLIVAQSTEEKLGNRKRFREYEEWYYDYYDDELDYDEPGEEDEEEPEYDEPEEEEPEEEEPEEEEDE